MLDAAAKALSQILSPPMRSILWRSIGLALVLIAVLAIGLQRLLSWLATSGEAWAAALLGPAIPSLVASLFVDDVADHVEREHYPAERPGTALPLPLAITEGVKTASLTILVY